MFAAAEITTQASFCNTACSQLEIQTLLRLDILNGKTVPLDQAQISWTREKKELAGEYIQGSFIYVLLVLEDATGL